MPPRRTSLLFASACLGLLALTAWADYLTRFELRLGPFYLTPALLVAWRWRAWGIPAALAAVAAWRSMELLTGHVYSETCLRYWDIVVHLVTFTGLAWAVGRTRTLFDRERRLTSELQEALDNVRELRGLLPICAWCRKVRNDEGYWEALELYVSAHSNARWTHSICPECSQKMLSGEP